MQVQASTTALAIRFDDPSKGKEMCVALAEEMSKITGVYQRIIIPSKEIEWRHGEPPFKDPTVFWVLHFANESDRHHAAPTMEKIMKLVKDAAWFNCTEGSMVWGKWKDKIVTKASINLYFCKNEPGAITGALNARIIGCELTEAIHAGPPNLILPKTNQADEISFYGIYESVNVDEMDKNRELQYADKELIAELEKITPYLRLFGRVRGADILYPSMKV